MAALKEQKTIHYLATKEGVIAALQQVYAKQGLILSAFDHKPALDQLRYFLVVEPLMIGQNHYSVSRLWKQWFMRKAPQVHLIVAAFAGANNHPNFLSLLDLPKKLETFLSGTQPVEVFAPVYMGVEEKYGIKHDRYRDAWEIGLPHSGEPVKTVMERFLYGHDKAHSFLEQLTRLRLAMLDMQSATAPDQAAERHYHIIETEFNHLLNRWYRYERLLPYLPFWPELDLIFSEMKQIKSMLGDQGDRTMPAESNLAAVEKIRDILKEKLVPIVHAEDYW